MLSDAGNQAEKRVMKRIFASLVLSVFAVLVPATALATTDSTQSVGTATTLDRPHPRYILDVASVRKFPQFYRVRFGDTLSKIAARKFGHANRWAELWWTNRHAIKNPNVIRVGQKLRISAWHAYSTWKTRRALAAIPPPPVTHHRRYHAGSAPAADTSSNAPVSTGGMSSFENCVIQRESGGNPRAVNPTSGAGGLFQFLPSTWASLGYASSYPGGAQTAPVSVQEAAFAKLYAEAGTSPWAPYDGC